MISRVFFKKGILSTVIITTFALLSIPSYAENSMPAGWNLVENTPYSITGSATNGTAHVGFVNILKGDMNNIPSSVEDIAEYINCLNPKISENEDNGTYDLSCSNNRFAKVVASDINNNIHFEEPISEYLRNNCTTYLKAQTSVFYTIYFFVNTNQENAEALSALSALYQYKASRSSDELDNSNENNSIVNVDGKPIDNSGYINKSKSYLISKLFQGYNLTKEGKAILNEIAQSQKTTESKLNIIIFGVYHDLSFANRIESNILNNCINREDTKCIETTKSGSDFLYKLDKLKAQKYETVVADYLKSKNAPVFISHNGDFVSHDCAPSDKACEINNNFITITLTNNPYQAIVNEVLLPDD